MRINNLPNATRWELINMYAVSVLFIYFYRSTPHNASLTTADKRKRNFCNASMEFLLIANRMANAGHAIRCAP